jgi:biotin carboxyl carrier protein
MDTSTRASHRPGKRAYFFITLFALLLVIFPFLFWYGTWFGRRLTDRQIEEYLNDTAKPRHAQHALVQIGERLGHGDSGVQRWYSKVVELSHSRSLELRQTAAWIMGQDHRYAPFHEALFGLLHDPSPLVQRNAALSLSNFHDPAALPVLREMLKTYTLPAPAAGTVHYRLKAGEYVNPGTLVARIGETEVRSPLPGEVRDLSRPDGSTVQTGDPLIDLAPDEKHVWEALRALYEVGGPAELDDVKRYARGVPGMPDRIQRQATITAQAIEARKNVQEQRIP